MSTGRRDTRARGTSPRRALLAPALAAAATLALGGALVAPAQASRSCPAPRYPGVGYFTSLNVSGASCAKGASVANAQYRCRIKHGKAGQCHKAVLGYRCSERRVSIPTEIDARVKCRRGSASIEFTYQQDL